jgi:large subunit ribosomal protein L6
LSRIGKKVIKIEDDVTINISNNNVTVSGPKGQLNCVVNNEIKFDLKEKELFVISPSEQKEKRALQGLYRALIANMVEGVVSGFEKKLELVGIGYRAQMQGENLQLSLGFSHPVIVESREGIHFSIEGSIIKVFGIDKQLVGQIAAELRNIRPPDPYKGKGVRYVNEIIVKKKGKSVKK